MTSVRYVDNTFERLFHNLQYKQKIDIVVFYRVKAVNAITMIN